MRTTKYRIGAGLAVAGAIGTMALAAIPRGHQPDLPERLERQGDKDPMAQIEARRAWVDRATLQVRDQPQGEASDPWAIEFDQGAGMTAWIESTKPGKFHEYLGKWIGDWDVKMELYMDPSLPAMAFEGSSTIGWLIEGRWVRERMELPGMPGMGGPMISELITGYDNIKRQFVGTMVDSMSTEMRSFKGGLSRDGMVMTMFGEMDEPITGEHAKMVRYTTRVIDDDHFVVEVCEILYGEPFVVVRIHYARAE